MSPQLSVFRIPNAPDDLKDSNDQTNNQNKRCKVTSNINGNFIFLPAAGCCFDNTGFVGSVCFYRSSSLDIGNTIYAYLLLSTLSESKGKGTPPVITSYYRDDGCSIRPVCE